AIPGRHAVELNFASVGGGLEKNERITHAFEKIGARDFGELRFGIVQVVDVDALELEIAQAARHLIFEEARSHTVAAGDEVLWSEDAGLDVFVKKIFGGFLGHRAVGSQVAPFGADDEFFAGKTFCGELLDGCADAAFAALEAVIDGGVDEVNAGFSGGGDSGGVACIDLRIGLAEI